MAQFSIRPARPEDCGTILELIRGIAEYEKMSDEVVATEETIRHAMFDEHVTRCLLAELDGKVIGYALYFYNYSTFIGTKGLYLEDLFLYPEYRKAGYGKRLIRELFKIAAAENCGRGPFFAVSSPFLHKTCTIALYLVKSSCNRFNLQKDVLLRRRRSPYVEGDYL